MYFQLIELHLSSIVAFAGLEYPASVETYKRLETEAQGRSYNQLVGAYEKSRLAIPELLSALRKYGSFRNSLTHRYMIDNVAPFLASSESRARLCAELRTTTGDLRRVLDSVVVHRSYLCERHGFSPRDLREVETTILTGAARIFERKIPVDSKVVVTFAYVLAESEFDIPIFETAEGALLYLASDGLQPARAEKDKSLLRCCDSIQQLLPAIVVRRPKRQGPWSYDIRIGASIVEVRPDRQHNFTWRLVRKPEYDG
jgi:hypothetical protein